MNRRMGTMKIYTRTGDHGETSLFAGGRISKAAARLHAYGTVDELSAILGLALAAGVGGVADAVERVQRDLFAVGADLATPLDARSEWLVRVETPLAERLEREIDDWQAQLPALGHFILPGGTLGAAFLHQARTVCRRAERWTVSLGEMEPVNPQAVVYLNRLSDWLFVAARRANAEADVAESVWRSGRDEEP